MATALIKLGEPQRGIILPLLAVSMFALLAMVGLVLDTGHLYVNKTRLQNALQATALSTARSLEQNSGNTALASDDGIATFNQVLQSSGNEELNNASYSFNLDFSNTLRPWGTAGTAFFVRASITDFTQNSVLIQLLGINSLAISASAVAGPSSQLDSNGMPDSMPIWNANPANHLIVLYPDFG